MKMTTARLQQKADTILLIKPICHELDPIAQEPNPKDGFAVNGVSATMEQPIVNRRAVLLCGKTGMYDKGLFV
jgi:hypothetical protein